MKCNMMSDMRSHGGSSSVVEDNSLRAALADYVNVNDTKK